MITGKIHSLQSLGTVDGPGVRFVVFMQGCNLRCGFCHNPDTWETTGGTEYTPEQILQRVLRCKEYFGKAGGITISGGEPLLQADFCREVFTLCHQNGINTCLDTSGSILNENAKKLLTVTDRVLLDVKYINDADYTKYAGCSIEKPLEFLAYLQTQKIPVTLRQVIVPTITDNEENVVFLKQLSEKYSVVDKIELLPFRKICQTKYDTMGIDFRFGHLPEPTPDKMQELGSII